MGLPQAEMDAILTEAFIDFRERLRRYLLARGWLND